ncbi:MAG: hypothetical protein A2589_02595 [Candidatus Vogelbacteria bacterium RIFOXYD1_FULL_46_19]|uniref:30S ribosomal protein S21 n=1 Tax=Candidatus Vogelbacteria bacterium RIFOXYD1_FULL_46_19 TaxID=1802439 RepID=A0A1G2QH39_9BACT|nr:MAG: hypothetical protein A2589_02595 [Candidatus Vogelbacteria bacterium RIFOXYD1_FULL_46_19]
MIIVEIEKSDNESNASMLRRFSKRVRNFGHLKLMRKIRYATRPKSKLKKKQDKLKRINKYEELERLKKLGKVRETTYNNR